MSEDIPSGSTKVLAERIETLCESVDSLRTEIRELRTEIRNDMGGIEARVRRLEEARAREEGSNYDRRLAAIAEKGAEQDREIKALSKRVWLMTGASAMAGGGLTALAQLLGGGG
jgi:predicted RNase H-like nuclease (RuvC/YqgF family)